LLIKKNLKKLSLNIPNLLSITRLFLVFPLILFLEIFFKIKYKKLYFDLPKYVKSCLLKNKIKNIETLNIDTFDINNNFFSARRALRLNHDDYGRNISIIMLN